jgi:broad specificity phosphatase PhoE
MEPTYKRFVDVIELLKREENNVLRLILTRHGRTELNTQHIFQPWTPEGDKLTNEGKEEAKKLGKRLSSIYISKIFTSDWHRALHTAQIINEELNPPLHEIIASRGLRDFNFGIICGMNSSNLKLLSPELSDLRTNRRHLFEVPNGDNYKYFFQSKKEELERIIANNSAGNILIVSHSYVVMCLLIAVLDLDLGKFANYNVDNASINIVEIKSGKIPGELLIYNDIG